MSVFDDIGTVGGGTPFDEMVAAPEIADNRPVSDEGARETARLAAVGEIDLSAGVKGMFSRLEEMTNANYDTIKRYGDAEVRARAATQQQERELRALANLDQPGGISPELSMNISAAAQGVIAEDIQRRQEYALEQNAIERIQDLAAAGDTIQAKLLLNNLEHGGPEDVIRDINVKRMILQREIDKAGIRREDQSWFRHAADFVIGVVPLYGASHTGNVPIADELKEWYDWVLPAKRYRREAASLWNLNPADFAKTVREQVIPGIDENSRLFGYYNNTEALQLLSGLADTPSPLMTNGIAMVDSLSFVPFTKLGKAVTLPGLMIRNGARREAADMVAAATVEITQSGTESALARTGLSEADVVDNLLPTAVNPRGAASTVPVAADATTALEAGERALAALTDIMRPGRFANDAERAKAIEGATRQMTEVIGRPVKDVSIDTVPTGAGKINRLAVTVGRAEGGGFASEASALRYANSVGWDTEVIREGGEQVVKEAPAATAPRAFSTDDDYNNLITAIKDRNGLSDNVVAEITGLDKDLAGLYVERLAADGFITKNGDRWLVNKDAFVSGPTPPVETVLDESGQWFVKVTRDIPETGFYTNALTPKSTSELSNMVLSSRRVGDEMLANMAQMSGNARAKILREVVQPYIKKFNDLGPKQKESLGHVLAAGEKEGIWHTDESLDALYLRAYQRAPSRAEREAYHAAREINDLEYYLRNDELYVQRLTKGFESATFEALGTKVDRHNALVKRELNEVPKTRVFDVTTQRHMNNDTNTISVDRLAGMQQEGYMMVTLDKSVRLGDGTEIKTFIGKKSDLSVGLLRRDQIPYRAGGHRMYRGKYFVKQARHHVQPDTMKKSLLDPSTYIVTATKAEADRWAATMERARLAVINDNADADMLDDIFGNSPGYPTGKEFLKGLDDGTFAKDTSFRGVYDREQLDEYLNVDAEALQFVDLEEGSFNGYLRTNGRMYYGGKGEQLKDYRGELAQTIDPFETINRSLKQVANLSSFSDYKLTSVERWVETFKNQIDWNSIPKGSSNSYVFSNAKLLPGGSDQRKRLIAGAEGQRQVIRRTVGWADESYFNGLAVERRINEWILGDNPDSLRHLLGSKAVGWWEDSNPISALRSLASDMKLGMWNVAQFPLQIGTSIAAATVSPKYGAPAFFLYPFTRRYMTKAATEKDLDLFIQRGAHKMVGMEPDDFKDMFRHGKRSGFFDIGGSHILTYDHGVGKITSEFGNKARQVREAGRFFFNEGEFWNRNVAWRIAWGETREKFPNLATDSEQFARHIAGKAEEYAWSMSEQSSAQWQKGLLSIPTQFWAYNSRMLEMMVGGVLTTQQKIQLIAGQTLLYGAYGLPVLPFIAEHMKTEAGDAPDIGTFLGLADRGILDTVIYHMTGEDIMASRRIGTGSFLADTVGKLFGYSAYGEVSFADIVGGATFSIMGDLATDVLKPVIQHMQAESGGDLGNPISRDNALKVASNVSSVSNFLKGLMVMQYGTLKTRTGTVIADDLPDSTAWGVALGLQPGIQDQVTAEMGYFKKRKQAVKDAEKMIRNYRTRMATEDDNREDLREQINLFSRTLPPDIRREALKNASRDVDRSLADSLHEQMIKNKARRAALEEASSGVAD